MSDAIKQIYDEMELEEVICRLPSEFAISSLKRRLDNVDKFVKFFRARDSSGASKHNEIKNHINEIISKTSIDDIFNSISSEYHPVLFSWLNKENKKRLLKDGKDKLTIEFIFNLTDSNDLDGMKYILNKILSYSYPSVSKILSVLNKIDKKYFQLLIEPILKDSRPIVRSSILSVYSSLNFNTISDHQKMIALKAFSKIPVSQNTLKHIQRIDFKLFKNLKPLERIMALDRYLIHFPMYCQVKVFDPEPTQEELDMILFAGCFKYNDVVEDIIKKYNAITKDKNPEDK